MALLVTASLAGAVFSTITGASTFSPFLASFNFFGTFSSLASVFSASFVWDLVTTLLGALIWLHPSFSSLAGAGVVVSVVSISTLFSSFDASVFFDAFFDGFTSLHSLS